MKDSYDQNIRDILVNEWGKDLVEALEARAFKEGMTLLEFLRLAPIKELEKFKALEEASVA